MNVHTKLMQHPELPDVHVQAEIVSGWQDNGRFLGWVLRFPGEAFDRHLTYAEMAQLQEASTCLA